MKDSNPMQLLRSQKSIVKATLTQQVCAEIKSRILYGDLEAGQRIWADELAENLGVSIAPVKEAFLILAGEGLITNIPRRGSVIRQFTATDMHDLYDLREMLELRALDRMFEEERISVGFIDDLKTINKEIALLDEGGEFSDRKHAFDLDWAFHQRFVENCGHDMVLELYSRLNTQSQIVRYSSWNIGPRCHQTIEEHQAVIQGLEERNHEKARNAIAAHLGSICADFDKALPKAVSDPATPASEAKQRRRRK